MFGPGAPGLEDDPAAFHVLLMSSRCGLMRPLYLVRKALTMRIHAAAVLAAVSLCSIVWGDVVVESWAVGERAAHPKTIRVTEADGGGTLLDIDLTGLPKGAAIRQARLLLVRPVVTGETDEAMTKTEVFALKRPVAGGGKPAASPGAPGLKLLGPWYDSLDATEPARQAVAGGTGLQLLVKTCPKLDPDATQLEIVYDGKPTGKLPPAVGGLEVVHRAGQTFLTWQEIEDPIGDKAVTLAELQAAQEGLGAAKAIRYRVYRHTRPIDPTSLGEAELLAEVAPLSGYNVRGVSVDRLIYQHQVRAIEDAAFARSLAPGVFDGYDRKMPQMGQVQVGRLAIQDGKPLAPGRGLYVHTAAQAGPAYYAVLTSLDGRVNTVDLSPENRLAKPVDEQVGLGEPVFQGVEELKVFYDYPGQRRRYVQWCAPPLANLPNQYYNWGVYVPPAGDAASGVAALGLGFYFHDWRGLYLRPRWPHTQDMVLVATDDSTWPSFGYGYHESLGTLRSFGEGVVRDYTARRLDAFFDWACKTFKIDLNRLSCHGVGTLGGTAAVHYALRHPERFALVVTGPFDPDPKSNPPTYKVDSYPVRKTHLPALEAVWGKKEWDLKTAKGVSIWQDRDLVELVAKSEKLSLPVFSLGTGSMHPVWPQENAFMKALMKTRQPFETEFFWGQTPPKFWPLWAARGRAVLVSVPTEAELAKTPWYNDARWQKAALGYWGGGSISTFGGYDPASIVDTADKFEATLRGGAAELTLRNAGAFKPKANEKIKWEVKPAPQDREAKTASGEASADGAGVLTIAGPLPRGRLTVVRGQ